MRLNERQTCIALRADRCDRGKVLGLVKSKNHVPIENVEDSNSDDGAASTRLAAAVEHS